MRDHHFQTPPQKANRLLPSKSISDHVKKNQKIFKKSLNSVALSVVSKDDASVSESPNDWNLIDFTSTDISEHDLIGELSEDLTASSTAEAYPSPGSEAAASSVLTPLSSKITFDDHEESVASTNQSIISKPKNANLSCFEAELVAKHLKVAQIQLSNARNMDLQSKKLLDALINVIIKEFYEIPEEEEGHKDIIPNKAYLAFINILLIIVAAFAFIISFRGSGHTFNGPTPT